MNIELIQSQQSMYESVWEIPGYREKCHSLELWHNHREIFPTEFHSSLDIGCGRGTLLKIWNEMGVDAHGVDFASNCIDTDVEKICGHKFHQACLWEMNLLRFFFLGICIDVMEHIPEEMISQVLERIRAHCQVVIFKIANYPSNSLGYELHPTLKPADWWQSTIAEIGGDVFPIRLPGDGTEKYYFTWYT